MKRLAIIPHTVIVAAFGLVIASSSAEAALKVNITKSSEQAIPIAVIPFKQSSVHASTNVASVVQHDLASTGLFKALPVKDMPAKPHTVSAVNYKSWQKKSVDNLVIGKVSSDGGAGYRLRFHLLSTSPGKAMAGWQIKAGHQSLRGASHVAANLVYKELLGEPGYFQSQLAYVTVTRQKGKRHYKLMVSDYDGHDPSAVFTSSNPIMSPAFSPNGKKLAYVAFNVAKGRTSLRVQDLATGKIQEISSRPGINGAPAWSPDGSKLALTLSYKGNPNIYVYNLNSGKLRQLTHTDGIDTEPSWSANGQKIAFTSNRAGKPQIYRMNNQGGNVTRITYDGVSNQSPVYGPNGKLMAFVRQSKGNGYRVAIRKLNNQHTRIISNGPLDERPSFAPNGQAVIYDEQSGPHSLVIASVKGGTKTRLSQKGHVQDPTWGAAAGS